MTSTYQDGYVIKLIDAKPSTGDVNHEVQSLVARIKTEDSSPPPLTIRPDGVGVSLKYRDAAERLVDNPRINREGKQELYLDIDAQQASTALTHR